MPSDAPCCTLVNVALVALGLLYGVLQFVLLMFDSESLCLHYMMVAAGRPDTHQSSLMCMSVLTLYRVAVPDVERRGVRAPLIRNHIPLPLKNRMAGDTVLRKVPIPPWPRHVADHRHGHEQRDLPPMYSAAAFRSHGRGTGGQTSFGAQSRGVVCMRNRSHRCVWCARQASEVNRARNGWRNRGHGGGDTYYSSSLCYLNWRSSRRALIQPRTARISDGLRGTMAWMAKRAR